MIIDLQDNSESDMDNTTPNWHAHGLPYRQAETLEGIAEGLSDKEMAFRAGVARGVISQTVQTLYYKLRITRGRRGQLVAEAIRQGVLTSTSLVLVVCLLASILNHTNDTEQQRNTNRLTVRALRIKPNRRQEWAELIVIA